MRLATLSTVGCLAASLGGCTTASIAAPELAALLAEAPDATPPRLWIAGDRIVQATAPLGPGGVPHHVRTAAEAVAPGGELLFQGREWGPRGAGFRVEKRYREGAVEHLRSVLVAADGRVLERAHTVPLVEVPRPVLAAAVQRAPHVEEAWIVSGPEREDYWLCTLRDRIGRTFVTHITLDGRSVAALRRVNARVDV